MTPTDQPFISFVELGVTPPDTTPLVVRWGTEGIDVPGPGIYLNREDVATSLRAYAAKLRDVSSDHPNLIYREKVSEEFQAMADFFMMHG